MPSTALFVIDIQHEMCGDASTEVPNASTFKPVITTLLERARSSIASARAEGKEPDLCIVFVQHEEASGDGLVRGTDKWELYFKPNLESPDERLVAKTTPDTFESNPELADELKKQGVKQVVACGIQTDMCVRYTSKGALSAGFDVAVLQGAHETYDTKTKKVAEIKKSVEAELEGLGAKVVPWEEWTA